MILALSRCPSLLLNTSGFDTNQSQMTCFEALGCHVVQRAFIRHLWAFRRLRAAPKAQSCSQVFELCNAWISKVLEPMLAINTEITIGSMCTGSGVDNYVVLEFFDLLTIAGMSRGCKVGWSMFWVDLGTCYSELGATWGHLFP